MIRIKVPATTANMGPGFDSIGMALSLYNFVEINEGTDDGRPLSIHIKPTEPSRCSPVPASGIPTDETNLIYTSLNYFYKQINKTLPPLTIVQENHIPMTGGLGSSAACIVAGLLAGNALSGARMPLPSVIDMASYLDGHPDNTTPALAGGLTVGVMTDGGLVYSKISGAWETALRFALFLPSFTLPTVKARAVLPDKYDRADAVFNASRTALLTAAFITGDFSKLATAMDDRIHQPYRRALMPGMAEIEREAKTLGAYNVFLSGAGSALIAVTEDDTLVDRIRPFVAGLPGGWSVSWIKPDFTGAVVSGG